MDAPLTWKAAETRVTAPFPTSDRSLENIKLRLEAGEAARSDPIRYIESVEEWDRLAPELFVDVDTETLTADTGLPVDGIVVAVIIRDREMNKFGRVAMWRLDDLPRDAWPLDSALGSFSRCARLDVCIVASPDVSAAKCDSAAIPHGAMLGAKIFKVRVPKSGIEPPVVFVEPSRMEEQGLAPDTICYVYWKGEDVAGTPDELIEIWLNKTFEDKFRALSSESADAATLHIGRNISAYVYANILEHVLGSDDIPDNEDSLIGVIGDLIEQRLGLMLDDAREAYRAGPMGRAKLMPWCWRLTDADKAFAAMKF